MKLREGRLVLEALIKWIRKAKFGHAIHLTVYNWVEWPSYVVGSILLPVAKYNAYWSSL